MTDAQLKTTPVGFAALKLGMKPYDWQARALSWFEMAPGGRVKGSICTPNGAGKDAVVISSLALWWIFVHRRGRVIITSYDHKQIEDQTRPSIHRHAALFPDWRFLEGTVKTDTGGWIRMYSTDDPGRVEGAHRETYPDGRPNPEGPLLIILNECKSLPDPIIDAFDRMTYDGMLYASSPGPMRGRFYESQFKEQGFNRLRVGLKDCPHKTQEQLDDIIRKYGENHPFTRSTLMGEFMEADGESHFDLDGLKFLREMAEAGHGKAVRGTLQPQAWQHNGSPQQTWSESPDGWVWMQEAPRPGLRYIGFCDPMTGEQSEGSLERDTHAAGIIRAAYTDSLGHGHDAELVAAFYVDSEEEASGCAVRWHNDVLASRLAMLLRHYGNCPVVVEANNSGTEVIRLLMQEGCNLWRREKPNHRIPGKQLEVVGFQTTSGTKSYLVGAMEQAIRHRTFDCRFLPAVKQMETFIRNEKGAGESQQGCHDDYVLGIALGLLQINAAQELVGPAILPVQQWGGVTMVQNYQPPAQGYGACA